MKYIDMINQLESFKYSSNLKYDLYESAKVKEYIPTKNSLKIFKDIFYDITNKSINKQSSKLVYGAYGSGKSSFLTVLGSILGKTVSDEAISIFFSKAKLIDADLTEDLKSYINKDREYLIIPVDGHFNNFHQCIYYSVMKVLEEKNISFELEETYNEALKIVKRWNSNENSNFDELLSSALQKYSIRIEDLANNLFIYDSNSLRIFKNIFSEITHGVEFIPKLTSFHENLDIINDIVKKHNYEGIIYIFDEFGKYLEDNIDDINVIGIQELAEYCDHGKYNNSLILVSHKEILQYTKKTEIEKWKKVQSRFEQISFNQDDEEILYLIKNVLAKKGSLWNNFKERNEKNFNKILNDTLNINVFPSLSEKEFMDDIIYGLFPIHPVVAKLLILLSKKIAQNERTIFTVIASNEENSLGDFLRKTNLNNFAYFDIGYIFDYFSENIKKDRMSLEFREYLKIQTSINKLNKDDKKYKAKIYILKAIGIINLVNDFDSIKPYNNSITSIINLEKTLLIDSINELMKEKIILYSRQYKYYMFFDASTIDVEGLINEVIENKNNTSQALDLMNQRYVQFPVLPDLYNFEYKLTRYYYPIYMLDSDLSDVEGLMHNNYYDGLLIYVLTDKSIDEIINLMNATRTIYVYSKAGKTILEDVKKLMAIEYLLTQEKSLNEQDPKIVFELYEYKNEIDSYIHSYMIDWSNPSNKDNIFISNGKVLEEINSVSSLSIYMSSQLFENFAKTLIVNNELINKNKLSLPMIKARKDIINSLLLLDELEPSLGYNNLSANHTFIRSLLELNGLLNDNEVLIPALDDENSRISKAYYVMEEINKFTVKCEKEECSFSEIINILRLPPYGLRQGYITVLIATALRRYRESMYIRFNGSDQAINGELFENILKNPSNYSLAIDHWPKDKEEYISSLEKNFRNCINWDNTKVNRLKSLYEGILNHYKKIPKFSRTTIELVSEKTVRYREIIEKDTRDYRNLFFNEMNLLGKDYNESVLVILKSKNELETALKKLEKYLIASLKEVFKLKEDKILDEIINLINTKWKSRIEDNLQFLTGKFIDTIIKLDKKTSNEELVKKISSLLTGFQLEYLSDNQVTEFINTLESIYADLNTDIVENENECGSIKILLEDENGKIKRINFKKDNLTENGHILKNILLSSLDNFGQSLNIEDKRQVVYEILTKYI